MGQLQGKSTCFNYSMADEPSQIKWKGFLRIECQDLLGQCVWAQVILKQLKQLQTNPMHKYYRQLKEIDSFYRQKTVKKIKPKTNTKSYSNSILKQSLHGSVNGILDYKDGKENKEIIKMIKKSEIFEDDIIEALQKSQQSSFLLEPTQSKIKRSDDSMMSYSVASSTPSYAYQERRYLKQQLAWDVKQRECIVNQINYFLRATQCFEKHLQISDHQLHQVFNLFLASVIKQYGNPELEDLVKVVFEIQQFSRVMATCFEFYYDIDRIQTFDYMMLLTSENMLNFVVCQIMDQRVIYDILYKMIADNQNDTLMGMREVFRGQRGSSIKNFNIAIKFQLNLETYEHLKKDHPDCADYCETIPYELAINQLKKIRDRCSPSSKLKVIIKMSQMLMKCIQKFYKKHAFPFDGIIDADDLLPIQTYILLNSELYDLSVHTYMIEKLATNKLLQGSAGYYMINLQVASESLLRMSMT